MKTYYLYSEAYSRTPSHRKGRAVISFERMHNGEVLVHRSGFRNGRQIEYLGRKNGKVLSLKSGYSYHARIVRDMWLALQEQGWTTE